MNTNERRHQQQREEVVESIYNSILHKIMLEIACGIHRSAKTGMMPYSEVMAGSVLPPLPPHLHHHDAHLSKHYRLPSQPTDLLSSRDGLATLEDDVESNVRLDGRDYGGDNKRVDTTLQEGQGFNRNVRDQVAGTEKYDGHVTKSRKLEEQEMKNESERETATKTNIGDDEGSAKKNASATTHVNDVAISNKIANGNDSNNYCSNNKDIYGRFHLKEPKYPTPCPVCGRNVSVSRLTVHLEKCMGLSGRGSGGGSSVVGGGGNGGTSGSSGGTRIVSEGEGVGSSGSGDVGIGRSVAAIANASGTE